MTRPFDTCWAVVMPSDHGPRSIPPWIGRTRQLAIALFLHHKTAGPASKWPYHYRRGMRCIRVDVVPHGEKS